MNISVQINGLVESIKMQKTFGISSIIYLLIFLCLIAPGLAQENEKDAQTGFQFLSINSDGRAAAMAEAMTTIEGSPSALFFNPAGMTRLKSRVDVNFSINRWIADIQHSTAGFLFRPVEGKYGVLGLSLRSVDYGTLQGTMVWPNALGYVDTEEFSPSAFSVGIGYAKALSDKFAVGFHLKNASSQLGNTAILKEDSTFTTAKNVANSIAYDFGTIFHTGIKSIVVGMSVKNFSTETTFSNGEENFQLPLTFTLGFSADFFEWINYESNQSLLIALDATHPRSHREQIKFGLEYLPLSMLALRTGYLFNNDEDNFSFGVGVNYSGIAFDYALTPFGRFGNVQRLSLRISL